MKKIEVREEKEEKYGGDRRGRRQKNEEMGRERKEGGGRKGGKKGGEEGKNEGMKGGGRKTEGEISEQLSLKC